MEVFQSIQKFFLQLWASIHTNPSIQWEKSDVFAHIQRTRDIIK